MPALPLLPGTIDQRNCCPGFKRMEYCTFLQSQSEQPSPHRRLWESWCWAGKDGDDDGSTRFCHNMHSESILHKSLARIDSCLLKQHPTQIQSHKGLFWATQVHTYTHSTIHCS